MYSIQLTQISTPKDAYHFLQTEFWATFKDMHGWTPYFFSAAAVNCLKKGCDDNTDKKEDISSVNFNISVLVRKLKSFISIAYVPLGIELSEETQKIIPYNTDEYLLLIQDTAHELKKLLPKTVFCIRFDPPIEFLTNEEREVFLKSYKKIDNIKGGVVATDVNDCRSSNATSEKILLKKSPTDVQPPDTVLLPLAPSEEELLTAMKPKWRYNIRLAEKKGVTVRAAGAESIDSFYKVFMETASRDRIAVHGKDYYKSLLELKHGTNHVKTTLYIAEHEGDTLAGIITLFTDTEAVYLYGASSDKKRNLMPAYLLQWTAIQDAKKFGSKVYDFYGIPPTDDEHHPMHGLYRFKTGFGGTVIHRAGSLDMPVKLLFYAVYIALEKMRAFYFKKVRKLVKHR